MKRAHRLTRVVIAGMFAVGLASCGKESTSPKLDSGPGGALRDFLSNDGFNMQTSPRITAPEAPFVVDIGPPRFGSPINVFPEQFGCAGGFGVDWSYFLVVTRGSEQFELPTTGTTQHRFANMPGRPAGVDELRIRAEHPRCSGNGTAPSLFGDADNITYREANVAPVADAGPDQTITAPSAAGADVTLDGSASTDANPDDVATLTYTWELAGVAIPSVAKPTIHLAVNADGYDIKLTVKDDEGSSSSDIVNIKVLPPANVAPVAHAGADQSLYRTSSAGVTVAFDGSGSSDADAGDVATLTYEWRLDGALIASGKAGSAVLPLSPPGGHDVELTVTDEHGASSTDVVNIKVLNVAPVAKAGGDISAECTSHHGANVQLNGAGSSDVDGTIASWVWTKNGQPLATGPTPDVSLSIGTHTIVLTVTDNDGATHSDEVVVTLQDTQAPTISLTVSPSSLWPPNHELVLVATSISAADNCDTAPSLTVSVSSNESANGRGDGNTRADWEVKANPAGGYDVWVRSERSGRGRGRIYTITATSTDAAGNTATRTATVTVAHDKAIP